MRSLVSGNSASELEATELNSRPPLHVLYVIDSLVPSGAERSLASLARHYIAAGVRLDVAYLHERGGLHDELRTEGAGVFSLAGQRGRIGWIARARHLTMRRRPDLIHTTLFEADVAGRIAGSLMGVPVVSSLVNVAYGKEQLRDPGLRPWKVRSAQLVDAATAQRVVRFHALTAYVADVMSRRLHIPRQRVDVVPRGRDPDELGRRSPARRNRARAVLDISSEHRLVLAAGRQERQKGLDVLVDAFPFVLQHVPEARLVIAGREGNQTGLLNARVRRFGLEGAVRLLGSRNDLPDLICGADVFVLPSRWEGLGSVLLEAMALESPIVASDLPPIRELLVNGSTGQLVPPGEPRALASAIVSTLANTAVAAKRARQARVTFLTRFVSSKIAEQMLSFYDRALTSA